MGDFKRTIPTEEEAENREHKTEKSWTGDLELFLVLMICPELVAGDGQSDQVEEGGNPAVEGGLLVTCVQRRHPLLVTPILARLTAYRGTFTTWGAQSSLLDTLILGQICT